MLSVDVSWLLLAFAAAVCVALVWWCRLYAVGTPDHCSQCKVCFVEAAELVFSPRKRSWYKPRATGEWTCDACIYQKRWLSSLLGRRTSLLDLRIPSRVVSGANLYKSTHIEAPKSNAHATPAVSTRKATEKVLRLRASPVTGRGKRQ